MICMIRHDASSGRAAGGAEQPYDMSMIAGHGGMDESRLSNANAFKLGSFSFLCQCWDSQF